MSQVQMQPKVLTTGPQTQHVEGGNVGQLGERQVQPGGGNKVARFFSTVFGGIRDAFVGLKDRIVTHFAEKRAAANEAACNKAATKFVTELGNGPVTTAKLTNLLSNLLSSAGKANPQDPSFKATGALISAFQNLTPEQQATFAKQDWGSLGQSAITELTGRFDKARNLQTALSQNGMAEPPTKEELQSDQAFIGQMKTLLSEIQNTAGSHKQDVFLSKMPSGITVSPNGQLGGTQSLTRTPPNSSRFEPQDKGRPLLDVVQDGMTRALNKDLEDSGTQKITGQASKDIWRLDMDMPTSQGVYKTSQETERNEGPRRDKIVTQLRDFTGSDKATTVMSSALTQSVLRLFHDSMLQPDGNEALMRFPGRGDATFKRPDGSLEDVHLSNYGNAKYTLSKDQDGNFRVDISWQLHMDGIGRAPNPVENLPLHDGGVVRGTFNISYVVDKTEAEQGRLKLSFPQDPTVTFSGGLDMNKLNG